MNHKIPRFSVVLAAKLVAFVLPMSLHAQTEVVPVQPTTQVPPQQVVPVQPAPAVVPGQTITATTTETVPVQPVAPAEVLAPGEHVAEVQLTVSHGSLQAYFGRAPRNEKIEIGDAKLTFKMPSTATVTKLASRDKNSEGSTKVTPDNPWSIRVRFSGPGRYVFNIVEWDHDPVVTSALLRVDGQVVFAGHGSEDNFNGWAEKTYGPGVVKSGSREVAFVLE